MGKTFWTLPFFDEHCVLVTYTPFKGVSRNLLSWWIKERTGCMHARVHEAWMCVRVYVSLQLQLFPPCFIHWELRSAPNMTAVCPDYHDSSLSRLPWPQSVQTTMTAVCPDYHDSSLSRLPWPQSVQTTMTAVCPDYHDSSLSRLPWPQSVQTTMTAVCPDYHDRSLSRLPWPQSVQTTMTAVEQQSVQTTMTAVEQQSVQTTMTAVEQQSVQTTMTAVEQQSVQTTMTAVEQQSVQTTMTAVEQQSVQTTMTAVCPDYHDRSGTAVCPDYHDRTTMAPMRQQCLVYQSSKPGMGKVTANFSTLSFKSLILARTPSSSSTLALNSFSSGPQLAFTSFVSSIAETTRHTKSVHSPPSSAQSLKQHVTQSVHSPPSSAQSLKQHVTQSQRIQLLCQLNSWYNMSHSRCIFSEEILWKQLPNLCLQWKPSWEWNWNQHVSL